jgi:hypothetical protein
MHICSICQGGTELDDVVLTLSTGGCICLACYCLETDSTKQMSAALRQAVEQALARSATSPVPSASQGVAATIDRDPEPFPRDWKPWWQTLPGSA